MGIVNLSTRTYHPKTNGKMERFDMTIFQIMRCYVADRQCDWDTYLHALTYA